MIQNGVCKQQMTTVSCATAVPGYNIVGAAIGGLLGKRTIDCKSPFQRESEVADLL